jgi:hypothetical protein
VTNTRITYLYRDASNNKQSESVVVHGELSFGALEPYLDEDLYFIPDQVELEDLQTRFGGKLTSDDHPWHELHEEDVEQTDDAPTLTLTAEALLERFQQVQWDESAAGDALGIPY